MSEKHPSQTLGEEFVAATLENIEHPGDTHEATIDLEILMAGFTTLLALVMFYSALAGYSTEDVIAFLRDERPHRPSVMRLPLWAYVTLCACAGLGLGTFIVWLIP